MCVWVRVCVRVCACVPWFSVGTVSDPYWGAEEKKKKRNNNNNNNSKDDDNS